MFFINNLIHKNVFLYFSGFDFSYKIINYVERTSCLQIKADKNDSHGLQLKMVVFKVRVLSLLESWTG